MSKHKNVIVPVVAAVVSLILFLLLSTGLNYYAINQNNRTQQKTEQQILASDLRQQQAIEQESIARDIQNNNQTLCDIIVTTNQAVSKLSAYQKEHLDALQIRIINDYKILAVKYKCGMPS